MVIIGCSESPEPAIDRSKFERIGELHNEGLSQIFEGLKENKSLIRNNRNTSEVLFDFTGKLTIDFVKSEGIIEDQGSNGITIAMKSFNPYILKRANSSSFSSNDSGSDSGIAEVHILEAVVSEVSISEGQSYYVAKLDEIMSSINGDLDGVIKSIKLLELEMIENLSIQEAEMILASTSIARHSLQYWQENYLIWLAELSEGGSNEGSVKAEFYNSNSDDWDWFYETVGNMGKSDVVGGTIGGVVGAGGVGVIPGAIAGACYASAGRGIVALLDKWGLW